MLCAVSIAQHRPSRHDAATAPLRVCAIANDSLDMTQARAHCRHTRKPLPGRTAETNVTAAYCRLPGARLCRCARPDHTRVSCDPASQTCKHRIETRVDARFQQLPRSPRPITLQPRPITLQPRPITLQPRQPPRSPRPDSLKATCTGSAAMAAGNAGPRTPRRRGAGGALHVAAEGAAAGLGAPAVLRLGLPRLGAQLRAVLQPVAEAAAVLAAAAVVARRRVHPRQHRLHRVLDRLHPGPHACTQQITSFNYITSF